MPAAGKIQATEAIGTLKAYAFIAQREGQDSLDMHRLVRLAMQNWLEEKGELKRCITSAIKRLDQAFPFPEYGNIDVWMKYLPHAKALLELREHSTDKELEVRPFGKVAMSHSVRRALRLCEKVLGKGHERSTDKGVEARLFANVAGSCYVRGQYQTAEQMYRQVLELRKEALGKDHPVTLDSMNNLALVLDSQGKYEEAKQMHRQILEIRETVLGKDHPDTLNSMYNLAVVLCNVGRYEEAEQMRRQEWKLTEEALGKEHPDTLVSMNNLGVVLENLGKYEAAEHMYRQILEIREQALGKGHPDTRQSRSNLKDCLRAKERQEVVA